ncbi:MAG: CCC motif membrane protein [Cellulophaga sp.]|uniref:CCC motif membrane protein n=1 Tax=Cellulophaga sp. TaxID=1972202 RepID=UPI0032663426
MKEELPGASGALTMGIIGLVTTAICCGPFGVIFSIISIVKANKATKIYKENPEKYINYSNANTGKVLSIISFVIAFIWLIVILLFFGPILAFIGLAGIEGANNMQY